MSTVLVTGASGCIGSNLIRRLLADGHAVRVLRRTSTPPAPFSGLPLVHFIGDVREPKTLRDAFAGCELVFHTAAVVSFWRRRRDEQMEVNVGGTRNVVDACLSAGVRRLVHTSSVAALGYRTDGQLIDERTAFNWDPRITYKYSKHLAESEVTGGVRRGLDAVIVNPTVVIGPRDSRVHGGQIVVDIARGNVPASVRGGMNIVSVHDVVDGHIRGAQRGRQGERYILGGRNMTHRDVFRLTARLTGGRAPVLKFPVWLAKAVARGCDLFGAVTGKEPWITSELISGVGMNNWYSSEKAETELGYTAGPVEGAILEAYEWYRQEGIL